MVQCVERAGKSGSRIRDSAKAALSMRKMLGREGRRTLLPIIGDTVVAVCISTNQDPELVFCDPDGQQSMIRLSDRFSIGRGLSNVVIEKFSCSARSDPTSLSPLLGLLGSQVTGATAFQDGRLELSFSNSLKLEVFSTTGYEAWHFQYPRPGRPPGGDLSNPISVHGADGHLT
jgi:hypothetical protein